MCLWIFWSLLGSLWCCPFFSSSLVPHLSLPRSNSIILASLGRSASTSLLLLASDPYLSAFYLSLFLGLSFSVSVGLRFGADFLSLISPLRVPLFLISLSLGVSVAPGASISMPGLVPTPPSLGLCISVYLWTSPCFWISLPLGLPSLFVLPFLFVSGCLFAPRALGSFLAFDSLSLQSLHSLFAFSLSFRCVYLFLSVSVSLSLSIVSVCLWA